MNIGITIQLMIRLARNAAYNALTVLEKRYLKKGKNGRMIEAPGEMFWRVARGAERVTVMYGEMMGKSQVKEE